MRFAISAMAGVSGLTLIVLAFYGQPAVYMHEALEEWASLIDWSVSERPAEVVHPEPSHAELPRAELPHAEPAHPGPVPDRLTQLQNEMTRQLQREMEQLKQELAALPTVPPEPAGSERAGSQRPASAPVTPTREATRIDPVPPRLPEMPVGPVTAPVEPVERPDTAAADPVPRLMAVTPPAVAAAPPVEPPKLAPVARSDAAVADRVIPASAKPPPRPGEQAKAGPTRPLASRSEPLPRVPVPPEGSAPNAFTFDPVPGDSLVPDVRQPDVPATAQVPAAPPEPVKADAAKREASKEPTSRPAQQKVAVLKPVQTPPSRRETEDPQSVLARLRQLSPSSARQAPPPPDPRPAPIASPVLPRLAAARNALADGRVEDARRMLQETQLQLVFRPIDEPEDDPPRVGRSAADVAHSLEALSANNIPLSRRYIDKAADDLMEPGGGAPVPEPELRSTGYAPAYPPR